MFKGRRVFVFVLIALVLITIIGVASSTRNTESVSASTQMSVEEVLATAVQVSSGFYHTCAVTNVGGVKCWGYNYEGQLGDGTYISSNVPVDVFGLGSGVSSVSAGNGQSCVVTNVGGVKCWGLNNLGQLGDGTRVNSYIPVDVVGLGSGVSLVSSRETHTCGVTNAGGVKCWGQNRNGQLGDGTNISSNVPVDVVGLGSGVDLVSVGGAHTCVVTNAGGAKCWGSNYSGQVGDGTRVDRNVPVDVVGLGSGVSFVSPSLRINTCAVTNAGGAKCWGPNEEGQLGDGTKRGSYTPVDVVGFGEPITTPECDDLEDTDGDAIPNGWEVCGYDYNLNGVYTDEIDIKLPEMGADWRHKDVFLEIDYMDGGLFRNFKPDDKTIQIMVDAFDNAPVYNKGDGTTGIHLHVDYGKDAPLTWGAAETWGELSQSDELKHEDDIVAVVSHEPLTTDWTKYAEVMQFSKQREHVFHYQLDTDWIESTKFLKGISNGVPGQFTAVNRSVDLLPLFITRPVNKVAGVSMHELGHGLGLGHGGEDDIQYKPNYLSIMNYSFTEGGLIIGALLQIILPAN